MINRPMTGTEWAMLLTLSVLWGGSFFFNGVIVRELPPLTAVAGRLTLAAAVLVLVARATKTPLPTSRAAWTALFVVGLLNSALPGALIVWGQTRIESGLASILNATTPLFTVLLAHVLTRDDKLTAGRIAGVAFGLVGVVVMIGPELLAGLGGAALAQLACVGAALSYGLAGIYGRRFAAMGMAPLATATGQIIASAAIVTPLALLADRPWEIAAPSGATWAAIAGIGMLSTALAYILFFRILAGAGPTNVALVTLLIPVSAILLGAAVLGERLEPEHFVGMALIAAGLAAIDGRLARRLTRRPRDRALQGQDI